MIPPVLHVIWMQGWAALPDEYRDYWHRWAGLHPSWRRYLWDDRWLSQFGLVNQREYDRATTPAGKADVARFELLLRFGGVYVDADVEPLRFFDDLLDRPAFAGREDDERIATGVMGCTPDHPLFAACIERLPECIEQHPDASLDVQSGPTFFTGMVEWWDSRERRAAGKPDIDILPPVAFYPYHFTEADPGIYPAESFAVHHWGGSWT